MAAPLLVRRGLYTAYLIGGCTQGKEKGCSTSIDEITLDTDNVERPISVKRSCINLLRGARAPAVAFHGKEIFVVGGCDDEGHHSDVQRIDLVKKTCEIIDSSQVPTSRSCTSSTSSSTEMTIVGGYDGLECLNTVETFTMPDFTLKSRGNLNTRLKNSTASLTNEGKLRLYGGWDEKRTLSTVLEYDPVANTSVYIHQLPYPVECHSSVHIGDVVFIFGGWTGVELKKEILRVDTKTNDVIVLDVSLDIPMECTSATTLGESHIIVAGGWNGHSALDTVHLFKMIGEKPYLVRVETDVTLTEKRNRPVVVGVE